MTTNKIHRKPIEQIPEGFGGGAGGGGGGAGLGASRMSETARRVQAMSPQERAALLENVGKQFEGAVRHLPKRVQERADSMSAKERAELENIGEQFRVRPENKKKGGVVSASRRADGIAKRGKTRGKVI